MLNNKPDSYIIQEGVRLGSMRSLPVYIDTTDDSNVYLGYCDISCVNLEKTEECFICKIHISNGIITKYHALGKWADRTTLEYK